MKTELPGRLFIRGEHRRPKTGEVFREPAAQLFVQCCSLPLLFEADAVGRVDGHQSTFPSLHL